MLSLIMFGMSCKFIHEQYRLNEVAPNNVCQSPSNSSWSSRNLRPRENCQQTLSQIQSIVLFFCRVPVTTSLISLNYKICWCTFNIHSTLGLFFFFFIICDTKLCFYHALHMNSYLCALSFLHAFRSLAPPPLNTSHHETRDAARVQLSELKHRRA